MGMGHPSPDIINTSINLMLSSLKCRPSVVWQDGFKTGIGLYLVLHVILGHMNNFERYNKFF